MKIGIDLDNTLACYDTVFARLAAQHRIVAREDRSPKRTLRDALRVALGGEALWTRAQGEAYGPAMRDAIPYAGARDAMAGWARSGHEVVIISHRTRFAALGPAHDLHERAREWIERWFGPLNPAVFLEVTRWMKVRRIESERCDVFIDDLPDVFAEPTFPGAVGKILFVPDAQSAECALGAGVAHAATWAAIERHVEILAAAPVAVAGKRRISPERRTGAFEGDPGAFFTAFVARALDAEVKRWTPLPGGINNFGARLLLADGRGLVGKIYKRSLSDPRDRLQHETLFLRLVEGAGLDCVPRVLAVDKVAGAALHTSVPGSPWPHETPAPPEIWAQFSEFLGKLRDVAKLPEARGLPLAAEAGRSLQEHLAWVQQRRDLWRARALAGELRASESRLVLDDLEKVYQRVASDTVGHREFHARIGRAHMILSPSDFGLHNALVADDGRVSFVDFEYAGWDDPAKTEIDFACQPRHRSGRPYQLGSLDGLFDRTSARTGAVRALLMLKWRYIILASTVARPARADADTLAPAAYRYQLQKSTHVPS